MRVKSHWHHAILTIVVTVIGAGILLPLVRREPSSVHEFLHGLKDWIRIFFVFALCVLFVGLMFKLLSPRAKQLEHMKTHPPAWLAMLLAWAVIAFLDIRGGFNMDGYRPTVWEWLGYGGGSLFVVGLYTKLWHGIAGLLADKFWAQAREASSESKSSVPQQDLLTARWEDVEAWLHSDKPARYDLLDHRVVADRVTQLVLHKTRSIGIVGPFGAGKTSIVEWIATGLSNNVNSDRHIFLCSHSCWGFETSATAIRDILESALEAIRDEIDTFEINSLPDSYRRTFSAGGDWIQSFSELVLRAPATEDQFSRLSDLLGEIDARLVIIVEDLDRNETQNFEIQEVLGFLERIKAYPNLSFVLTGGLSSSRRIDYAKLCDHIEYLRAIQPQQSIGLHKRVIERCSDMMHFPHTSLNNPRRNYEWNELVQELPLTSHDLTTPVAITELLRTPRSLRLALWHSWTGWKVLYGEINLLHLIGINVLRFGAPECLDFLIRHWSELKQSPNSKPSNNDRDYRIRQRILEDWERTIRDVDWAPTAALQLMVFLLPATEFWLINENRYGRIGTAPQGIHEERYWRRSISNTLDADDIRDKDVLKDLQGWLDTESEEHAMVAKLTSLPKYFEVWRPLAMNVLEGHRSTVLLLCEQVIRHILLEKGSTSSYDSLGFSETWAFASPMMGMRKENQAWLESRLTEAAKVSIEMVNSLWHYYGNPGRNSILRREDGRAVRKHAIEELKSEVTNDRILEARLSPTKSDTLYQLVFDLGNETEKHYVEVKAWSWLGPYILAGLKNRCKSISLNCTRLLGARVAGQGKINIDLEVLNEFFGKNALEAIDSLELMKNDLPDNEHQFIEKIISDARKHLNEEGPSTTPT